MGPFGDSKPFVVTHGRGFEQPGRDAQASSKSPSRQSKAQQNSGGAATHAQEPAEFRFRSQAFDQQSAGGNTGRGAAAGAGAGSSAFAELDTNQDPFQRARSAAAAKDASSMGDQAKQQAAAPAAAASAAAGEPAAAPPAAWASFLSGFQQQVYVSPGARAAGRRAGQRKGATPKASRMQQQSTAAGGAAPSAQGAAAFGSPAGPMFAFGSPMQQAGNAAAGAAGAAAGPAQGAGNTPAPSTLPPGSAMSMDTTLPDFTAAFSAMSVDAATPAFGSNNSSSQAWAFPGPRAAAVTGKRLFDTPSSAGGDSSTPSPFGSWGRPGAEESSAQQAAGGAGASRVGANPVPFPGFGGAQDGAAGVSSPAGGFAFNPGKPSPASGRKGRHQRGSPAQKPPPVPGAFAGFGSPAFQAGSSSAATPGMASAGSFQGFFARMGPGSVASTPGFSPMMWSPVDGHPAQPSPAGPAAAVNGGDSFETVAGRQQAAAASQQREDARLQQVAQQQEASTAAAAAAAELLAAAAVDLPSDDDSTEAIAEQLRDLSTSGNRAAQAAPESAAMADLTEAVEQLSTAEKQGAQQQQQHHAQAATAQQPAAPAAFVFGSPDHVAGAGMGRSSRTWLSSPGEAGAVPTALFDMSPLKSAGATVQQRAAAAAPSQQDAASASTSSTTAAPAAAPPAFSAGAASAPAAAAAPIFGPSGAAGGGFSFTPGKGSGAGKATGRTKTPTPAKQHKAPAAAAAASSHGFGPAPAVFGGSAAAAGQSSSVFGQPAPLQDHSIQQQQQPAAVFGGSGSNPFAPQQQQQQPAAGSAPSPGRRKFHAPQRRSAAAGQQQTGSSQGWQATSAQPTWPPAAPAAIPSVSFTLGTAKATGGGTPVRSPRKGRRAPAHFPQPHQQQAQAQPGAQMQEALRQADIWTHRAQASFAAQNWVRADGEFEQGMAALQPFVEQAEGAQKLSNLHMHRAAVRIGGGNPEGALKDSLEAIKLHKKNIEAYLRTATCLSKLGCLTAADRVLDKVLDMISARHDQWQALNKKRQQVHQLAHKQQRVVAAALGCDSAAAAATLAALSAGQPVQQLLEGFISVSVAPSNPAAVSALADNGTSPLEDAAAAQELVRDAQSLITELGFWEDGTAMLAWLLLRSGQLDTAANVAEAQPNSFFQKQPVHGSKQWGWRWWVLAQVKWQQGDLTIAKQLLQEGLAQLSNLAQQGGSSSGGSPSLWRLLLPSAQDLPEILQQTEQLLAFKEAGNAAIQAKQYDKAAEAYTKALALQPSCGFAAVIHSNRAAALQQQQRLVEALADCSRAVALDPKYARAYLRMAQVLESLHRADRAVVVLQDSLKGSANAVDPATTRGHELTHGAALLQLNPADRRKFEDMLGTAQVSARRFKTPHHYKALGLAMGATEADIRKAYRGLALKHHPDKALQHCRWSPRLGKCGAAAAHVTAPSGGIEASLKAAANEVFGFLSAAHEDLVNAASRSKLDRDLRTEEQLYSNNGTSSSYSRPATYTYSYGGRRADSDNGFDDFFRRTANAAPRTYQQQQQARPQAAARPAGAGSGGSSGPAGSGSGQHRWYEQDYWADDGDVESDDDECDGYGGTGYHYRSKY